MKNKLSILELKEITDVLSQFGLNEKEQKVYLFLLANNKSTLTPISRTVELPVTTVQSVLGKMVKRGIVGTTTRRSRSVYEAYDPKMMKEILEREIHEISEVLPLLKKLKNSPGSKTKVKIFYEERMTDIFHEALDCQEKKIYEIVSAHELQLILGEKFHFTRRRTKKNISLKSLRVEKREIKKYNQVIHKNELREAKFLPTEFSFDSSIMFWDNKVAIFSSKKENLAIIMESDSISLMLRQFFDMLWSVSRRMETLEDDDKNYQ